MKHNEQYIDCTNKNDGLAMVDTLRGLLGLYILIILDLL
jgi:hypothetical protein